MALTSASPTDAATDVPKKKKKKKKNKAALDQVNNPHLPLNDDDIKRNKIAKNLAKKAKRLEFGIKRKRGKKRGKGSPLTPSKKTLQKIVKQTIAKKIELAASAKKLEKARLKETKKAQQMDENDNKPNTAARQEKVTQISPDRSKKKTRRKKQGKQNQPLVKTEKVHQDKIIKLGSSKGKFLTL
jgi:hypothetical protein